ncbi:MAG: hypothetical protein ACHQ50_11700 [Fimbriimonadales bacterium]
MLEHVDWPQALDRLIQSGPHTFYIIVQINPLGMDGMVAPSRVLPPSMAGVPPSAKPILVESEILVRFLADRGFETVVRENVAVPDGKTMAGFAFSSKRRMPRKERG